MSANNNNANNANSSNYPLDSHQYHLSQQYQQQYHFNNNNNKNSSLPQNKLNQQLPPALLPQPPQPLLSSANFNKNEPKIATGPLLAQQQQQQRNTYPTNANIHRQHNNNSLNRPNSSNFNSGINTNSSTSNQNGQRRPNQIFYNKSVGKVSSVVAASVAAKSVPNTNAVKPEVKSNVAAEQTSKIQLASKTAGASGLSKPGQQKADNGASSGVIANLENAEELTQTN